MRLAISLNWMFGTIFLLLALIYPVFDDKFWTGSKKKLVVQVVDQIARAENQNYQLKEQYILFAPGMMPPSIEEKVGKDISKNTGFTYEVYQDTSGDLVIKARAKSSEIKSGSLPPLVYTYAVNAGLKEWTKLSGKESGLFAYLGL